MTGPSTGSPRNGPGAVDARRRIVTVGTLGSAQTLAWGSSYYLPAVIAVPVARELGVAVSTVFAAFSLALVVSALAGPWAGRAIDAWGGRPVLAATNLVFAAGLALLGAVQGPAGLFFAWAVMGVAMGSGLYEAAFATIVRLHGRDARALITGITLIAGFASTVGWPLTSLMESQFGWRGACWGWALLHLAVGLPLNGSLPRLRTRERSTAEASATVPAPVVAERAADAATGAASAAAPRWTESALAFVFAATWFNSTAMAAHLPVLLQSAGGTLAAAIAAGALIGPAQVAARLAEFGLLRRAHPLLSARLASLAHPAAAAALLAVGAPAAAVFAILHGAGNGILTIAIGTLPLALFGPHGYGARQGLLVVPARIAQALSPWLFGLCLERWGARSLALTAALSLTAFGVLMALRAGAPAATGRGGSAADAS